MLILRKYNLNLFYVKRPAPLFPQPVDPPRSEIGHEDDW
jgi:hypothetical protein